MKTKRRSIFAVLAAFVAAPFTRARPGGGSSVRVWEPNQESWKVIASFHARNEAFWRGLVMRCGELLGEECYTQGDGGKTEEPLGLKVPEVLEKRLKTACSEVEKQRGIYAVLGGEGVRGKLNGMDYILGIMEGRYTSIGGGSVSSSAHCCGSHSDHHCGSHSDHHPSQL